MTFTHSQKKYNKQTKQPKATILMTEHTDFPRCPLRNTIDSQVLINDDNVHGVVLAMEAPLGRRWFFAWTAPTTLTIPTLDRIIAWIFSIFVIFFLNQCKTFPIRSGQNYPLGWRDLLEAIQGGRRGIILHFLPQIWRFGSKISALFWTLDEIYPWKTS